MMKIRNLRKLTCLGLFVALAVVGLSLVRPSKAAALSGNDFIANRIIDDSVFFNGNTMSASDIQSFLNAKVPVCDTWGTQPYAGTTRANYSAQHGYSTPFICLKDYSQAISSVAANTYCGAINAGTKSSATIIFEVAQACGVNPQALIVLLQKEQNLVTDDWPWPTQYRSATGYGCPDTAACDSQYYGFFNQVYNAAKQFKRYVAQPGSFNYAAGRTSFVAYQANNSSCGGTNLTLQNGATAALYNYTPYQPNAAALANLYGNGDGCSAYGNRNFWRLFNDWFGPTLGDLVRTVGNATVFLISGNNKYPIGSMSVLNDYMALGPIRFVTDDYVNQKTTGPLLGHMVGATNGTLYYTNAGIKLPFSSCSMVADFGYTCASVITLTDGQLGRLYTGPFMTKLYQTTSDKLFYMDSGQKREVFDLASLTAIGGDTSAVRLLESGIDYLPYGNPIIRDGVVVSSRSSGQSYLYDTNRFIALNADIGRLPAFGGVAHGTFDDVSIPGGNRVAGFNGLVKNAAGTKSYVLLSSGKAELTSPSEWAASFTTLSDAFLNSTSTDTSGAINNRIMKSQSNGTVYYVTGAKKRPLGSWADLERLKPNPFFINTLTDTTANSIANGIVAIGPTSLVKTPDSGTVYVVKSPTELFPIGSFIYPYEFGFDMNLRLISSSDLQSYTVVSSNMQNKLLCGGTYYVANNGQAYSLAADLLDDYGFNANDFLDGGGICANLKISSQALSKFIRVNNGTIYYVDSGTKRPFAGFGLYQNYGGNGANTVLVSDFFAGSIPNGSVVYQ